MCVYVDKMSFSQGTAADIIKRSMISVYDRLREKRMRAVLLLQVHDEVGRWHWIHLFGSLIISLQLVIASPTSEMKEVIAIVRESMEGPHISVPTPVVVRVGVSMAESDLKEVEF